MWRPESAETTPPSLEIAGPRQHIFFRLKETTAAIVTCGGLSPGLNNVIRSVFYELFENYGVQRVLGICNGYLGLNPESGLEPIELTKEYVEPIDKLGGTVLGSSRGGQSPAAMADFLQPRGIDILLGFGCQIVAFDKLPHDDLVKRKGVRYADLDELFSRADIITLHVPLLPETHHLINAATIGRMEDGVMLINTSRGGLVDTRALIDGLKSERIGFAGLDVYEEEAGIFFHDISAQVVTDDVLARLMTFNNVVVTSHQAFLTNEALANIADTTLANLAEYEQGRRGAELTNAVFAFE